MDLILSVRSLRFNACFFSFIAISEIYKPKRTFKSGNIKDHVQVTASILTTWLTIIFLGVLPFFYFLLAVEAMKDSTTAWFLVNQELLG